MSVVKKTAKTSLYIFSVCVILLICAVVYLYVNMDSLAKQMSEQVATQALGVPVTVNAMDISLEEKKVVVSGIAVANPQGYKKPYAIRIDTITIAAESFSKDLLTFARVEVDGTDVNLEVQPKGSNLGDLKKYIDAKTQSGSEKTKESDMKVIVKKFALTKAQLNPSVTLIEKNMAYITVPDIHLKGVGQKENGIYAQDAVEQIMVEVLKRFNKSANKAGFLEGLSLEALNEIGVSTADAFQKNLKDSFDSEVEGFKKGVEGLKNMLP